MHYHTLQPVLKGSAGWLDEDAGRYEGGMTEDREKQLLRLVFGGGLTSVEDITFKDLSKLDIVGIYPAWFAPAGQHQWCVGPGGSAG
jgi:hypothetical protein